MRFEQVRGLWNTALGEDAREPGGPLERAPGLRLGVLLALFVLPAVPVLVQVGLVSAGSEHYRAFYDRPRTRVRDLPAVRARILAADGTVLAEDLQSVSVAVHYRYIEDPPDARWLLEQGRARLDRAARRDPAEVERAASEFRDAIDAYWDRLAALTGVERAALDGRRREIQEEVERIVRSVERRRAARVSSAYPSHPDSEPQHSEPRSLPARLWAAVADALAAEPEPLDEEPLVIREQEMLHTVIEGVSIEVAAEIETRRDLYPFTEVRISTRRVYPRGSLAAHIVGYLGEVTDEELAAQQAGGGTGDYRAGDRRGRMGVEASYEQVLRGIRGEVVEQLDWRGLPVAAPDRREPRPGRDVVLTIDPPLQEFAEALLDRALAEGGEQMAPSLPEGGVRAGAGRDVAGRGGAIVVLDVRTGAVLAAATAPRFDPSPLLEGDHDTWAALLEHPGRPLFNRATQMAIPPGSVFKTLSAIAFLETAGFDPQQPFYCQGYLHTPDRLRCYIYSHHGVGHGETDLTDALCRSCNVYFYHWAERLGPEPICRWAERLGFGRVTGIDLPAEEGGLLPTPENARARLGHAWYPGDTPRLAIGQAALTATPLQIARLMAAVANDGRLVRPHVVASVGMDFAAADHGFCPPAPEEIPGLDPATLALVREGLEQVVADAHGTGHRAVYTDQIAIAGKTGTAEVGGGRPDHAWFAGYAPVDRPRVAFVVVLENAGSGGQEAGPLARELVLEMLRLGMVRGER